jgi:hypothetical protein
MTILLRLSGSGRMAEMRFCQPTCRGTAMAMDRFPLIAASGVLLLVVALTAAPPVVAGAPAGDVVAPCTTMADWPTTKVTPGVRATVVAYYRLRNRLPATIDKNRQYVLDVDVQRVGVHSCGNPDGTVSEYAGNVPAGATSAVMVYVHHQPYPETEAPANLVTLARSPGKAWRVVGEGTGP